MRVLDTSNDFAIRTDEPVHSGKVRSVYWLTAADSARLIAERDYPVPASAQLAIMIVSDRISAFDCIWHGEGGLRGVPGKGAALNSVSKYWFDRFASAGLARSHILEAPHPLVWVVQRAAPVMIEAIARRHITGSMWRDYAAGQRNICGQALPDGLKRDQKLPELLITPSTKGVLRGLTGVPEADDVNISRADLVRHWRAFGFRCAEDIVRYETLLTEGFALVEQQLATQGQLFVDTKFEFGYAADSDGNEGLIYMDEVGTPDSSRIWDADRYAQGEVVENSKELFRKVLLDTVPEADVLLNKQRMKERVALARETRLPRELMLRISEVYTDIAKTISGQPVVIEDDPRAAINAVLGEQLSLLIG